MPDSLGDSKEYERVDIEKAGHTFPHFKHFACYCECSKCYQVDFIGPEDTEIGTCICEDCDH